VARHPAVGRSIRVGLLVVALGLAGLALANRWSQISDHLSEVGPGTLVGASALVMLAVFAAMMSWRALLSDIGSRLPITASSRIVFLSQLGKYIPGSVWPYLAQVELGREHRVPRQRSAAVSVLAVMISLISGLVLAAATIPWASPAATRRYWPIFVVVPVVAAVLHPSVLNRLLGRTLRILKRPPLTDRISWRGIGTALAWAMLAWAASGISIWLLSRDVASVGVSSQAACVGAYALAWSAGFLFLIAPAGAGVREAAMVAALSPLMSTSAALTVALLSRLLTTGGDLLAAGVALIASRHAAAGRKPQSPVPDPEVVHSSGDLT
jgi:glycosyltransferase 2 family protein